MTNPYSILMVALLACTVSLGLKPAVALAATVSEMICQDTYDNMDGEIEIETDDNYANLATSYRNFNQDVRSAESCKAGDHRIPYLVSNLTFWHAWLLKHYGKSWADEMELAIQRLTQCTVIYFGTPNGAKCSNLQKRAIHLQTQWESEQP